MGKAGVNSNGPVTKELAELNCNIQYKNEKIREGVLGEGQGLSKEDEFKVNEDVQDVNEGRPEAVQAQVLARSGQQKTEQQIHEPRVCWEEFLSLKSLKVLLVENDDSTRHVVSALLRNCGYEVIAVANGIQAWKILEEDKPHVDLVLSEVVIPCLSGIDLLTKIMDHKTCQNVPVIMMSSRDSMSTVLNCLSKGAVDFLVKPIRKNELKTLWQHVWRKCQSSSGSGSESGIRSQISTKSTSFEESDKNTGSNYEDNIGSIALNARDEGDNGSGTEITQVSHSRPEAVGNDGVPAIKTRECEGQDEELDVVMRQDLGIGIGVPRIPYVQLEVPKEKGSTSMADTRKQKLSEIDSMKDDQPLEKGKPELNNEKSNWELRNQAVDLMGVTTIRSTDPQMQSVMFHMQNGVSKVPEIKDKVIHGSKEGPSLELSLKTQRDIRYTSFSDHDRNVLRHSDHSAFSRYKFPTASKQAPSGNAGSYSPHDNSSEAAKAKSLQKFQSHTNSTPLYQSSNGCSNNNDMGSTTNNIFTNEEACEDKAEPRSTINCLHPSPTFQPEHDRIISLSQPILQGKADAAVCKKTLSQGRSMNQQAQMQQHQMYNVHQHQHRQMSNQGAECGSSNMQGAPMEGNVGHHNLHGSASGSNHSSNGQSGGSSAINSRGTNIKSDKGVIGDEETVNGIGGVSKSGVDENHISHREAALNKFRQKRKDRCFEKKVRYQSRKKLADERPRVRGQFVRQPVHHNKGNDTQR